MKSVLSRTRVAQLALAVALMVMLAADASAFSHGRFRHSAGSYGGSYGSAGSYGGSYGASVSYASVSYASYGSASSGSYGSGGSYGSAGSSGRVGLFARMRARRQARRAARASGGSYGSAGSYGSSYGGSYTASYSSTGSYGGSSGVSYAVPVVSAPIEYSSVPVDSGCDTCGANLGTVDSATIHASVPDDAQIFVNDRPTTSTGAVRSFASNRLVAGKSYTYDFRVVYTDNGVERVETKSIQLKAGDDLKLAFGNAAAETVAEATPLRTELKLQVPANAKVFLAGSATSKTGESRVYASSRLQAGQQWDGYVVRVELERDGETLVEEKTLTIEAGGSYEVAFDFEDSALLATAN